MGEKRENVHQSRHGWVWKEFSFAEKNKLGQLAEEFPESEVWVSNAINIETNYLRVIELDNNETSALIGSLNYSHDPADPETYKLLHYYVTANTLITIDLDVDNLSDISKRTLFARMDKCEDAFGAFLVIIGELLNTFLDGIDDFEERLIELEKTIRFNNRGNALEDIFDRRSDMLFIKHLAIPIEEILLAMEEAFYEEVENNNEFRKVSVRLQRAMKLLYHYENQIETLLNMNISLYSYRGNEIIKALTVFTVLVTPITVFGALWGMNFKYMPEFEWKLGYVFAWAVILSTTGLIYWWLHRKGWTGDVLRRRGKIKK
ncbi:MAG TPA: magnesium transporter CorA family protein [Bacillaceae bacterium]